MVCTLGQLKKKVSKQIFEFWIFSIFRGARSWKNDHFVQFWTKIALFSTLKPPKNGKKSKFKNLFGYFFFNCPKVHAYQFLGQLKHFPETRYDFRAKLGYRFGFGDGSKNALFRPKKGRFFRFFVQIFGIDKNHLNTCFDQFWA